MSSALFWVTTVGLIWYNIIQVRLNRVVHVLLTILCHSSLFRPFGDSRLSSWTKWWHLTFNYIFRGPGFRVSLSDLGFRLRGLAFGSSILGLNFEFDQMELIGFRVSNLGLAFEVSALGSRFWVFGYGGFKFGSCWVMIVLAGSKILVDSGSFGQHYFSFITSLPNAKSANFFCFGIWFRFLVSISVSGFGSKYQNFG